MGHQSDPDIIAKAFDRLIKDAGVRQITFHGLRHTHISHELMDGVHLKIVSERAGHASAAPRFPFTPLSFQTCRLMPPLGSMHGSAKHSLNKLVASRWQILDFDSGE